METNEFTFAHDTAHGWLRVPHTMLMQLKIDWAISEYSYVETTPLGDVFWLEEDLRRWPVHPSLPRTLRLPSLLP